MVRAKVPMERITDDKKRKITFRNRKEGIFKKARELATLCDVNVSMIVCSDGHQEPEIFPPDASTFNALIDRYRSADGIMKPAAGSIHSCGISDFLIKDRKIDKTDEEVAKAKYPTWFDFMNNFSEGELREFASGLGSKIDQVKAKIESLNKTSMLQSSFVTSSLNPNPITTMINPPDDNNLGFDLDRLPKWLLTSDEDDEKFYDYANFIVESQSFPPGISGDRNNSIAQSSKSDVPAYLDPLPKRLTNDDDDGKFNDYEKFNLEPRSFPPRISGDRNNSIAQSSKSDSSAYLDSLLKWLTNDDDDDKLYDNENFNLEPRSFPPRMLQQPTPTPSMHANPLKMTGFPSSNK